MSTELAFLVEQSKQGNSHAFAELYDMFAKDLYRFALYMVKDPDDAEDAVQDAVLCAWKSVNLLRENELFKAWLFKILSNRCKKILASKNKAPDSLPDEDYTFLLGEGEEGFSFQSCELTEALKTLTPPDGQLVLLSVIGGFKSEEIAEIYGMPPGTVRSKQKRALEKLRAYLTERSV